MLPPRLLAGFFCLESVQDNHPEFAPGSGVYRNNATLSLQAAGYPGAVQAAMAFIIARADEPLWEARKLIFIGWFFSPLDQAGS